MYNHGRLGYFWWLWALILHTLRVQVASLEPDDEELPKFRDHRPDLISAPERYMDHKLS